MKAARRLPEAVARAAAPSLLQSGAGRRRSGRYVQTHYDYLLRTPYLLRTCIEYLGGADALLVADGSGGVVMYTYVCVPYGVQSTMYVLPSRRRTGTQKRRESQAMDSANKGLLDRQAWYTYAVRYVVPTPQYTDKASPSTWISPPLACWTSRSTHSLAWPGRLARQWPLPIRARAFALRSAGHQTAWKNRDQVRGAGEGQPAAVRRDSTP